MRFLKEVKEETSSRSKLKNILILISRLLALTALILAFAQPFLPSSSQKIQGRKAISIYIDNSFSMSALSNDVSLLNKAKQKAQEILAAYGEDERFQILSNDFTAIQQRLLTKEEALNTIDEITARPEVYQLSQVMNRQRQAMNQDNYKNKVFYQISDFQKNITDTYGIIDTNEQLNLLPLQAIQDLNISIDSCWFVNKVPMLNQPNQLVIKLTNHSNQEKEGIRLAIVHDDQTKPLGLKNIKAKSTLYDTANITISKSGWNTAEINIVDYPITFDDNYKIAFNVKEQIKVLSINDNSSNKYLEALFKGINFIALTNSSVNQVAYAELSSYELIILNDLSDFSSGLSSALSEYVKKGGNLLVFPSRNGIIQNYNTFLSQLNVNNIENFSEGGKDVGSINTDEFIFKDVFERNYSNIKLPKVGGSFKIKNFQSRGEETILAYRDGSSFMGKYTSGNGHIYLCSAPLSVDFNDLVQNAEIFVPMIFKMAISSSNDAVISYTIGKNRAVGIENEKTNTDIVYKVIGEQEFIPTQLTAGSQVILNMGDNISKSGIYNVTLGDNIIKTLAFNYDNLESELDYFNANDLTKLFGSGTNIFSNQLESNFTQLITEKDQGISLWKWCLILTLIFLAIEVLLLRFWKS